MDPMDFHVTGCTCKKCVHTGAYAIIQTFKVNTISTCTQFIQLPHLSKVT